MTLVLVSKRSGDRGVLNPGGVRAIGRCSALKETGGMATEV